MMEKIYIDFDYKWKGTLEEKLRLTSEYRIVDEKIKDTLEYLDELEALEEELYMEIMDKIEVRL